MPESGPIEVARAARAFNDMQQRIAEHARERSATLAAMSHDLKTPLNRLLLRAELLTDGEAKRKISQDLNEMESMVRNTLEFMGGSESGEAVRPIDMTALLESIAADARDSGGTVSVEGSARSPYVGRPQALKRCIGNLRAEIRTERFAADRGRARGAHDTRCRFRSGHSGCGVETGLRAVLPAGKLS